MSGVFVSFTSADKKTKDDLIAVLHKELGPEERIWDHEKDCVSNYGEECVTAIEESEVFIAIVSDASMQMTYVLNEIIVARECEKKGTLNILIYQITDSDYSKEFTLQLNHISDANRVARIHGTESGLQTVASRTKYLLARRRMGNPELPNEVFEPKIDAPKVQASGYFVPGSRDDIFGQFDQAFSSSNILFVNQMNGYGKKTACRKYVALHLDEYKNAFLFHQFSGSLREFFVNGLNITNINPDIYNNMSEDEIIQKKAQLLESLDRKTLFIIPNVTIQDRDDEFILNILYGLPCRIMFLTQSVPMRIRKNFPAISVGRMDNRYLKELFFHYYDDASEEEQDMLTEPLYRFFDSIDGHTGSIMKTASLLADEGGVYPEDLPEIFDNIHLDSENELGDRIFTLISEMFELTTLTEQEKDLLFLASLTAVLPMDEKQFIQMAKKCDRFDSKSFKKLTEQHFIDSDREHHLISMEPFMASVCLSKIPPKEGALGRCLFQLYDAVVDSLIQIQIGRFIPAAKRLAHFFSSLKMSHAEEVVSIYCTTASTLHTDLTIASVKQLCSLAQREADGFQDSLLSETMEDFLNLAEMEISTVASIGGTSRRALNTNLQEEYVTAFIGDTSSLFDLIEDVVYKIENPMLRQLLENLFNNSMQANAKKIITDYLLLTEKIVESDDKALMDATFLYIIEILGYKLIAVTRDMPYICLRLCRARLSLLDITGTINSFSEAYSIYLNYFFSLHKMAELTEEYDLVYQSVLYYLDQGKEESFSTEEEAVSTKASLIQTYVSDMVKEDLEQALSAYSEIHTLPFMTGESADSQIRMIQDIGESYIKNGETEEALAFLSRELTTELESFLKAAMPKEDYVTACESYEYLSDIRDILLKKDTDTGFSDQCEEYLDYYQSYPKEWSEKRLMKKYIPIAEKAKAIDFSSFTLQQIREKVRELSGKASRGERWERLAPEAFALVSEAGYRILGYRHHYVQYLGGAAMADGKIAEIQNGEGKTYTILLPAFLHSLYGKQVHIMDSSQYLTQRNYHWMRGVLEYLGCRVGLLNEAAALTEKKMEHLNSCHVIYENLNAPFLRLRHELGEYSSLPRYDVLIADEADQLLISQCDAPIILTASKESKNILPLLKMAYNIIAELSPYDEEMFEYKDKIVTLKPMLYNFIEDNFNVSFTSMPQQDSQTLTNALRTGIHIMFFAENGRDYYIINNEAKEENTLNGTLADCSELKRYFIGRKENNETILSSCLGGIRKKINYATVHEYVNHFKEICGTTATASSMRKEFESFYKLSVVCIPTNIRITRKDYDPAVFVTAQAKYRHIVSMTMEKHRTGQPVLIIAGSSPESELISRLLRQQGIPHSLLNVKNIDDEANLLGKAGLFGAVTVTNALANRGVDIRLGGNPEELAKNHLYEAGISPFSLQIALSRPKTAGDNHGELHRKYEDLTALYKAKTDVEKEKVEAAGGLCVIGTTCFDDLRTEQQVRGRSGRQGGIGESYIYYSLQDESLRQLIGNRLDAFYSLFRSIEDQFMEAPVLNKTIRKSRLALQKNHFDWIFHKPEILLYPAAKDTILGLRYMICKNDFDMDKIILHYFVQSERNIKDIIALSQGKKASPLSSVPVVYALIPSTQNISGRNMAIRALNRAYLAYCDAQPHKTTPEIFSLVMKDTLGQAWSKYLHAMEQEIPNARSIYPLYRQQKNLNQHLSEFSKNQCQLLIEDAVSAFFRVRIGKRPEE